MHIMNWLLLVGIVGASPDFKNANVQLDARCGLYCSYVAAKTLLDQVPTLKQLEETIGKPKSMGYSLLDLQKTLEGLGLNATPVAIDLDTLRGLRGRFSCIAHYRASHYAVLADIGDDRVTVIDPPEMYDMDRKAFESIWSGQALLVSREPIELPVTKPVSRGGWMAWPVLLVAFASVVLAWPMRTALGIRGWLAKAIPARNYREDL